MCSSEVETNKILKFHNENKLPFYQFNKNITTSVKLDILTKLIVYITYDSDSKVTFKLEHGYNLLEFVVNQINLIYTYTDLTQSENTKLCILFSLRKQNLLYKLTNLNKGQHLLEKLDHIIDKLPDSYRFDDYRLNCMILYASEYGTLLTFLYWLNKTQKKLDDINELNEILIFAIGNSDDRLFKYILKKVISIDKIFLQNNYIIPKLFSGLTNSNVPKKYMLKRIKLLSSYVSLVPYFSDMIKQFFDLNILFEFHKHYYVVPYTFKLLCELVGKISNHNTIDNIELIAMISKFMSILKTPIEKIMYQVIISLKLNIYNTSDIIDENVLTNIIINNKEDIFNIICWRKIIRTLSLNPLTTRIIKIITTHNIVNNMIINRKYKNIENECLLFTKFLIVSSSNPLLNTIITVNNVLHRLRMIAKRRIKNKIINHRVKMFNILNEIKTFEPNNMVMVLNNGSSYYQLTKQKFNTIPPRHLLPGEITLYDNFLLKDKADGVLIHNLPVNIFPQVDIINNYHLKAEYIEEHDLYLVFDIDIMNTTIIERYNLLRSCHPYTKDTELNTINSMEEFIVFLEQERVIMDRFIKENSNNMIKWYPKFACEYMKSKTNTIMYKQLINSIIRPDNKILKSINYNCDGMILTPLNGNREIKIKPLHMMSIDLLFKENKWYDRNNICWDHIIKNDMKVKNGSIYRCYPILKDDKFQVSELFQVTEFRYDKRYPNSNAIVNMIQCIINYDWNQSYDIIQKYDSYYDNINDNLKPKQMNKNIIVSLKYQKELLEQYIDNMHPFENKYWLDLGCGSGKLINIIKKYNIKYYLGMDVDIISLVKALHFHDTYQDQYHFNPTDLSKDWETIWHKYPSNIKFDYIIANFSLMHFCSDKFWQQLDTIVYSGTKFLFNLVNKTDWAEGDSFMKVENDITTYHFEWVHNSIKTEPFIDTVLLETYLNRYNWKLIKKWEPTIKNKLVLCYSWFVIEKL